MQGRPVSGVVRLYVLVLVVMLSASCWSADMGAPISSAAPINAGPADPTFPRTAAYFLDQDALPPIDELAKYDVVVIDNDWANRLPRSYFDDLRARNPRMKLLAYVNVIDSVHRIGSYEHWPNAYKMWQIARTDKQITFPDQWLARTAAGTPVHEFEDRVMANLTDQAPRVNGQLFVEYAMDWITDTVWSAGIWDGVFLDIWGDRIYSADSDHWDVDRDGTDETDDQIYGRGGSWDRGLAIGEERLRAALPASALLVANGDRTLDGGRLNGRAFESFADPAVRPDAVADVYSYLASASGGGAWPPAVTININTDREQPGSPAALRKARFEFGATMLQDGYWAAMGSDYGKLEYYDEMDGAGRGRGYLGRPREANPTMGLLARRSTAGTGSPSDGVYRRDFDNGIVVVNTTPAEVTVPLDGTYTKLKGRQDPVVNDGSPTNSVTIGAHDAIVLLR